MIFKLHQTESSGGSRRSRKAVVLLAFVAVLLATTFSSPILRSWIQPRQEFTRDSSLRRREKWMGDIRTAFAMIHYILEAEPAEEKPPLTASNFAALKLHDGPMPAASQINFPGMLDSLAALDFEHVRHLFESLNKSATNSHSARASLALPEGPA